MRFSIRLSAPATYDAALYLCRKRSSLLQAISPTINTTLQTAIPFYLTLISALCLSTRSVFGCITKLPSSFEMPALNVLSSPGL
jgi:hypothetical protein